MFIPLPILRICIKIEKSSIWKRSTYMHISGCHTFNFGTLSSFILTSLYRGYSGRRWCRFWRRCTWSFALPACLRILCCAIFARKEAISLILMNHCQVSFHRSLRLSMPRKLNSLLLHFSDFGVGFLDQEVCFLHRRTRNLSFGHFGHIQGKVHVRLF